MTMADSLRALAACRWCRSSRAKNSPASLLRRLQGTVLSRVQPQARPPRGTSSLTWTRAVSFYTQQSRFRRGTEGSSPAFAMLYRGDLRLLAERAGPARGGTRTAAGEPEAEEPAAREPGASELPQPGGSNRIVPGRNGSDGDRPPAAGQRCPVPHRDHARRLPSARPCSKTPPGISWSCSNRRPATTSGYDTQRDNKRTDQRGEATDEHGERPVHRQRRRRGYPLLLSSTSAFTEDDASRPGLRHADPAATCAWCLCRRSRTRPPRRRFDGRCPTAPSRNPGAGTGSCWR